MILKGRICIRFLQDLFKLESCSHWKNMSNAKSSLEKRYSEEHELEDAIHSVLLTLKEGLEGEMNERIIKLAVQDLIVSLECFRLMKLEIS